MTDQSYLWSTWSRLNDEHGDQFTTAELVEMTAEAARVSRSNVLTMLEDQLDQQDAGRGVGQMAAQMEDEIR